MSIFGVKADLHDGSGVVTFRNHATNHYLSIDRFGSVSTTRIASNNISKNETLSLALNRNYKNPSDEEISFYIRSYYGHYLTFDATDNKLYCQKISHSIMSWRKHTSHVYARFSSEDLFYFSPASTVGIIGVSGISIYGNKYLCVDKNGSVSNKLIPGKHEMWVLHYIQKNISPNASHASNYKPPMMKKAAEIKQNEKEEKNEIIDNNIENKSNFDEKLFILCNLVQSNSKALHIYKQQIQNKTINVNTMSAWDKLYKRILMKENQWNSHKNELIIINNNKNNNNDLQLIGSLDIKYNEKYSELKQIKDTMVSEQTILNQLNSAKDSTNMILKKYNNEIIGYDTEINKLQNRIKELKNKKSICLNKIKNEIKPKINNQCECIMEKMCAINQLNTKRTNFEKDLTLIKEIKYEIKKFENDIGFVITYLQNKFRNEFEINWINWNTNDIIIWLGYLNNVFKNNNEFKFENEENKNRLIDGIKGSNLNGKDLKNINDLILRSFDIKQANDRKMILKCLKTLMAQMDKTNENTNENENENKNENNIENKNENNIENDLTEEQQDRQCVVCMDNTANMMFMPCNHIALCENCYDQNTFDNKCAFCGNKTEKVIKCYHVGF